ncbi:MAG: hypothetical protein MUF67_06255 [Desulfobacterales bacterium]|nr:hypothetical protein [Desulfobacterales bacterium]
MATPKAGKVSDPNQAIKSQAKKAIIISTQFESNISYGYTRQGAKEVCIYVIDNDLARKFASPAKEEE